MIRIFSTVNNLQIWLAFETVSSNQYGYNHTHCFMTEAGLQIDAGLKVQSDQHRFGNPSNSSNTFAPVFTSVALWPEVYVRHRIMTVLIHMIATQFCTFRPIVNWMKMMDGKVMREWFGNQLIILIEIIKKFLTYKVKLRPSTTKLLSYRFVYYHTVNQIKRQKMDKLFWESV